MKSNNLLNTNTKVKEMVKSVNKGNQGAPMEINISLYCQRNVNKYI